jgi:hypothetical protein
MRALDGPLRLVGRGDQSVYFEDSRGKLYFGKYDGKAHWAELLGI